MVYLKHAKKQGGTPQSSSEASAKQIFFGAGAVLFRPASSANQKRVDKEASCSLELQPVFFWGYWPGNQA